jgi:GH25 family lysozyme M1 (1,4-beta-N-acetylmuramidase)
MSRDYNITLPIYIDSESVPNGRANNLDRATRTRCLQAFCETINNSGYKGGVYASKSWFYNQLYADSLEQYNIWVAQYNTECNYTGKTDFWQYSSKETIAGIVGYVDVNVVRK